MKTTRYRLPRLGAGGTVGIAAPAGGVPAAGLRRMEAWFRRRGFGVTAAGNVCRRERYLAGDDATRAAELQRLFDDPRVDAIFSARGGYGSLRLLDRLDYGRIAKRPKLFVGFSDTTALQLALLAQARLGSLYGFSLRFDLKRGGPDPFTARSLRRAAAGIRQRLPAPVALRAGTARGPLIGGCLSLVASLVGTPWLPPLDGAILVLEDVNEEPYRVDRLLTQLRLAGVFDRVAGVALGSFTHCEAKDPADGTVEEVLREIADWTRGPVASGLQHGHQRRRAVLPLGAPALLRVAPGGGELVV